MTDAAWGGLPKAALLSGDEPISGADATLRDVWAWAMSDLRTNTVRPMVAEFLVAKALGGSHRPRVEWDFHDVETPDGLRVEVKSSAYLQAWEQRSLSKIVFSGLTARTWTPETAYSDERSYNAQTYVFALQTAKKHSEYDALDTAQWDFWVVPVSRVAATGKRSLGLQAVIAMAGPAVPYADLAEQIRRTGRAAQVRTSCDARSRSVDDPGDADRWVNGEPSRSFVGEDGRDGQPLGPRSTVARGNRRGSG